MRGTGESESANVINELLLDLREQIAHQTEEYQRRVEQLINATHRRILVELESRGQKQEGRGLSSSLDSGLQRTRSRSKERVPVQLQEAYDPSMHGVFIE